MEIPEFDKKKPLEEFFRDIEKAEFSLEQFLRTNEGNIAINLLKVSATKYRIQNAREYHVAVMKGHLDAYASLIFESVKKGKLAFEEVETECLSGYDQEKFSLYHRERLLQRRVNIISHISGNWFSGDKIWDEKRAFSGSYRMDEHGAFFVYPRNTKTFAEVKKNPWTSWIRDNDPEDLKQQLLNWKEKAILDYETKEKQVDDPFLLKELRMGIEKLVL